MKVSVIIPFYKVAPFVERCTRSLMEQTLQEVEFIFVDDKSPDESGDIIQRVVSEYNRDVKILRHSENKGLPAARNTGLEQAVGDYIFHCDSDDFLELTMLEDMYNLAQETGADYVYCDYYLDFGSTKRYMANPAYSDSERMVKEGFLAGMLKYNVWNKLVKRSLYGGSSSGSVDGSIGSGGVRFPSGHSMGEDMTMIMLGTMSKRVAYLPKALYHYIKTNASALTSTFSQRHLDDTLYNTERVLAWLKNWQVADIDKYVEFFKLNVKLPFLFTGKYSQYKLWHKWFPESNKYIGQNKIQPLRTRLVQKFAQLHLYPLVWLYCFAVSKLYYGLLFRGKA